MKKLLFLILFFGCFALCAQSKKVALKTYTFAEITEMLQQNPKPIVVFTFTNWCEICFGMKTTTFKNKEVIKLLNDHFYFVKLNAENSNDITFLGKTFRYKPSGYQSGIHELAIAFASIKGKVSYPTTTFLNSNLEITFQLNEYINSKKMYEALKKQLQLEED